MSTFNQTQYDYFLTRLNDVYAQTKYEILLSWLRGRGQLRVLNAGCGSGELSLLLAAEGHTVVGIDPEPEYIRLAREQAAGRFTDCTFIVSSIENYRGPGEFDAVISTDVLEHIADDHAAFNRLAHLVRANGLVLIAVPAGQWLFGYHDEQLGHFRRYSATRLRQLVGETCRVRKVRYFGCTLVPICLMYSRWLRKSYPLAQGGSNQRSLVSRILHNLLAIERHVHLPLGTSVLLCAERRKDENSVRVSRRAA